MTTQKTEDLNYGLFSETIVEPMIEEYFGATVNNTKITRGKWCPFDYETIDKQTRYELKTRRIKHNAFPTILISHKKIIRGLGANKLILLFLFLDGLYYIEHNATQFADFDIGNFTRIRDGKEEHDKVVHIPIKHLTKINL